MKRKLLVLLLIIPVLAIECGCASAVTATTMKPTAFALPVKLHPVLKSASIVNDTVSISASVQYEVKFSTTASMNHPTIVGSFTVLEPGATAFIDIFPVSDHDTTAIYQSGLVSSINVGELLLPGRYDLIFGTTNPVLLHASASFTLFWDQK